MEKDLYDSGKKIHKPIEVIPLDEYILEIKYDNGEVIKFDMKDLLNHPLFKSLNDVDIFREVRINGSSICWDNDIDICADSIYNNQQQVGQS